MLYLYDDRVTHVERNTGRILSHALTNEDGNG
jgi:hypothetical protein